MRPVVTRSFVVLALVAAAWGQAPSAFAEKGGHNPPFKQGQGNTFGSHITGDNRLQVFSDTETDLATGQVSEFKVVSTYDNHGLLVGFSRTQLVDGHVTESEEDTRTYGQANRLSKVVSVTDPDGEGPIPPSTRVDTLTRNNRHKLISIATTVDDNSDGIIDSTSTENRTFDQRGREVSSRVTEGGIVTTTTFTYDSHGNVLAQTIDTDDLSTPQSPDTRDATQSTYDQPHGLASAQAEQLYTFDASGQAHLQSAFTITFSRDQQGAITGSVQQVDTDGDGKVDITAVDTATYDKHGNLLSESGTSNDGTTVYASSQVMTYDSKGNAVGSVVEEKLNGVVTYHSVEVSTFDKFGRRVKSVSTTDSDGDGKVDTIETFTQAYDNKSRTIADEDSYTDGNGVLLFDEKQSTVYGKDTSTTTSRIDSDGDGVVDRTEVTVDPL